MGLPLGWVGVGSRRWGPVPAPVFALPADSHSTFLQGLEILSLQVTVSLSPGIPAATCGTNVALPPEQGLT